MSAPANAGAQAAFGPGRVVSFDDEPLILVDAEDRVVGHDAKGPVHDGSGRLHRAFSVFLFDEAGRLLLQQRSAGKRLWPLFWSNTCCSHPRRGEDLVAAAARRLREEVGASSTLSFAYKFVYQASFGTAGAEHEMCSVLVGRAGPPLALNAEEIAAVRWVPPALLDAELAADPGRFTPWLHLEWPTLRRDHWQRLGLP